MLSSENIIAVRKGKTVYRDGNRCIKIFDDSYAETEVLSSALNQARIESTGLLVPKILEVGRIEGNWAIISEFIEGPTLESLMKAEGADKRSYIDKFVSIQADILSRRNPMLYDLRVKMERKISEADIDETTRYELHTRLNGMPRMDCVCHGDFEPGNVIMSDRGPYIIDWAHVTRGNPEADCARSYLRFRLAGDAVVADMYLRAFCARLGVEVRDVQKWMPIVATSQSVKNRPEERDFLLSWANVAEY